MVTNRAVTLFQVDKDIYRRFTESPQYANMMAKYLEEQLVLGKIFKGT
jgi:hypothetical protein